MSCIWTPTIFFEAWLVGFVNNQREGNRDVRTRAVESFIHTGITPRANFPSVMVVVVAAAETTVWEICAQTSSNQYLPPLRRLLPAAFTTTHKLVLPMLNLHPRLDFQTVFRAVYQSIKYRGQACHYTAWSESKGSLWGGK